MNQMAMNIFPQLTTHLREGLLNASGSLAMFTNYWLAEFINYELIGFSDSFVIMLLLNAQPGEINSSFGPHIP